MKLAISYESQWCEIDTGTPAKPEVWLIIAGYEATVWPASHNWGWVVYDVLANKVSNGYSGTKDAACGCAESEIFNHARRMATT